MTSATSNYVSLDTLRFLLLEVHELQSLYNSEYYGHLDESTTDLMLQAAKDWADVELYPFFKEMDETPAQWHEGRVLTHPQLKKILLDSGENGWIGGRDTFANGGVQMPDTLYAALHVIFEAANNGAQGYVALSGGAAHLITSFGAQSLIDTYVPKMYEGHWQGTMALTEPQAGSSLTDITTSATPTEHGYYKVKGHKIFISGGDHQSADNFVHLTLARIEGAPAGVKGISLFVIPRMRPIAGSNDFEFNDVQTAGDFQKMGQRGYATTHLAFGDEDDCHAWLVGEPNKGLPYMFQMMNEARIGVGHTAAAVAMAAYLASYKYAQERPQGRLPSSRNPLDAPVPIIQHSDVKRMIMTQQVIVEGALSLAFECSKMADLERITSDEAQKKEYHLLLEFLTPIVKTYSTEAGIRSVSLGLQVLGGYGYTMDFPLQQYYRDIRIMALYEGTTGIQSLDLLGRKVMMENGAAFKLVMQKMLETILAAEPAFPDYAEKLQKEVYRLADVTAYLIDFAKKGEANRFTADATVYMEMTANIVIAWQWLKMALTARDTSISKRFGADYYENVVKAMEFYYRYELPHAAACGVTVKG
jgi:alkylation response protein AidB-like acyl-CoA dehydrogenase